VFAKDVDLIRLEPGLFQDVAWLAQRQLVLPSVQVVSASMLRVEYFNFNAWGIEPGGVLLIDGRPVEVIDIPLQDLIFFSMVRASDDDETLPVHGLPTDVALEAQTFSPQIRAEHDRLMRALGLATIDPDAPDETSVTNPRAVARVEALGALAQIYAAAAPLPGADSVLGAKAERYAAQFERERRSLAVEIDLDGDGAPDATRRINLLRMQRS